MKAAPSKKTTKHAIAICRDGDWFVYEGSLDKPHTRKVSGEKEFGKEKMKALQHAFAINFDNNLNGVAILE